MGTYSAKTRNGFVAREASGPKLAVNESWPLGVLSHAAVSGESTSYRMLPDLVLLAERNLALGGMSLEMLQS